MSEAIYSLVALMTAMCLFVLGLYGWEESDYIALTIAAVGLGSMVWEYLQPKRN